MNRRKFLKRTFQLGMVASIPTAFYTLKIEPYWVEFVHKKLAFPKLDSYWKGKKIIQISDLHIGYQFDWSFMIEELKKAQQLQPDLVVYTGDFINHNVMELNPLSQLLRYAPKGKLGTFAVLGNHDYGNHWSETLVAQQVVELLQQHNITVLRNEKLTYNNLTIAGVDDKWGTNFYPEKLSTQLSKHENTLLLCHNPDVIDLPIWKNFKGWMLSGHTHGGQCKPPFLPPPKIPVNNPRYTCGEFQISENQHLYINRALGFSIPARFNVRPEITVFELG